MELIKTPKCPVTVRTPSAVAVAQNEPLARLHGARRVTSGGAAFDPRDNSPDAMYAGHELFSPEGASWSVKYTGIPVSPSVYARIRSWLLQEQENPEPDLYQGSLILRKVNAVGDMC
ncbi:Protein of unknown function [Gryllus bimaculatus]|nr:Protein of unknown function [Gryllus bimaculatus]